MKYGKYLILSSLIQRYYQPLLPTLIQVKHIRNLAGDIDNFQYIRERIIEFLRGFDAAGCGKYIHPRTGLGENTIAGSRIGITKS